MIYRLTTIICLLASTASAQLGHPSLVGHWRFETQYADGELTKTPDSSGNGNHGTLVGSPTLVTGKVGRGYDFKGYHNEILDYIEVSSGTAFNSASGTVSMWIKPDVIEAESFLSNIRQDGNNFLFSKLESNGTVSVRLYQGSQMFLVYSTDTLAAGEWTHLAFLWGVNGNKIYVNGVGQAPDADTTALSLSSSTTYFATHSPIATAGFNGTIDEPKIYNRALTANEVRQLYYGVPLEMR